MYPQPDYAIYPTLLDSWWKFQNTKLEEFFYQDEQGWHLNYNEADGTYHYSQEEMDALLEQELIDKINRVPQEPSEAASKGTIFHGALDGFDFYFDANFCKQIAGYFKGALPQYYTEALLPCRYGTVRLYGWIDELCKDVVKDIKTTKRYEFGNYAHYWQRHVYPYCLIESGDCKTIKGFEFTVVKWAGGTKYNPVISGEMYKEYYTYDHCESSALIRQECERFIEFLESHKERITNNKIFNQDENNSI